MSLKKEDKNSQIKKVDNDSVSKNDVSWFIDDSCCVKLEVHFITVSFLSLILHSLLLSKPNYFVLNEEHYKDVLTHYSASNFILDVNPPGLTLVLAAISGTLKLDIDLSSASSQNSTSTLFYFRLASALSGSLLAPLAYIILRKLSVSAIISSCGAILILSNSILLTDSRFISANPIMAICSLLGFYFLCKTRKEDNPHPMNYLCIAVCLGSSMTMLHLGLNTFIFIICFVCFQEFQKFRDLTKPEGELWKRYLSIVAVVVFLPLLLYILSYWHLVSSCHKSSSTDKYLSPQFQVILDFSLCKIIA